MKKFIKVVMFIILLNAIGYLSSVIGNNYGLYETLTLPIFAPPGFVFGVVWTILYSLLGISLYRQITNKENLTLFITNIVLLFIWPTLFFKFNLYLISSIVILITIIVTTKLLCNYKSVRYLLIPYLLWIVFAFILNIAIWILN